MYLFPLPEVRVRYTKKKRTIAAPDLGLFKAQQRPVFDGLLAYVLDDSGVTGSALLDAPAGTGKTYCVAALIEHVLSYMQKDHPRKEYKIACTATTNKAVKVTYRQADYYHTSIDYRTVHSLLGLREQKTAEGKQIFVQDYRNPPELLNYDLLIVDESSMLDDSLFLGHEKMKGLQSYIDEGLKVIFTGDSCQIPPINRSQALIFDADAQETYNIHYFTMDEVVRQAADNPIIALATEVRRKLHLPKNFGGREDLVWGGDKGVFFVDKTDLVGMEDFGLLLNHIFCSENFQADPDFGKIISYHRRVVTGMNGIIRELLHGEAAEEHRLFVGEKLLVNSPILDPDGKVMIPNNEEVDVIGFTEYVKNLGDGAFIIPCYDCEVSYYRMDNSLVSRRITIPTNDGQGVLDELLELLADKARVFGKSPQGAKAWADFFEVKETFADVSYNYAITGHRAQGSTYQNAIVLEYDIDRNRKVKERQKIKYTAFTRPSQRLFVIN